jgi:hypothetical protein
MNALNGKKTYMLALAAVLGAAAAYLHGDMSAAQAIQAALTGAIGATLRSAISSGQ